MYSVLFANLQSSQSNARFKSDKTNSLNEAQTFLNFVDDIFFTPLQKQTIVSIKSQTLPPPGYQMVRPLLIVSRFIIFLKNQVLTKVCDIMGLNHLNP